MRPLYQVCILLLVGLTGAWDHIAWAEPVPVTARARQNAASLTELNTTLWQPLRKAFAAGDSSAYRACFADAAIIASGDMPSLNPLSDHLMAMERRFTLRRGREGFAWEPRFTERAVFAGMASERGIVQETRWSTAAERWEKTYREFHAFARNVDGVWRITVLYQRTRRDAGAATDYRAAAAAEAIGRF